ncbi:MAG: lipase family protein [Gammaproteobacteria bacterium]|nr:lipase family protein [Gammaproteobacteria bacterium]
MRTCYVLILSVLFVGCAHDPAIPLKKLPSNISIAEVYEFAQYSKDAYATPAILQQKYTDSLLRTKHFAQRDAQYFVLKHKSGKALLISSRGTASLENALVDAEYVKTKVKELDLFLHKGFAEISWEVYQDMRPSLLPYKATHNISLTGHSLGGAMAAILMMYLQHDGFMVEKVITFGQPKVTNRNGMKTFEEAPLLRIVHGKDPVPLVPPITLVAAEHGIYRHFGQELILLQGPYYVFLDEHVAEGRDVSSFWKNLGNEKISDHFMDNYLSVLDSKQKDIIAVRYDQRKRYEP